MKKGLLIFVSIVLAFIFGIAITSGYWIVPIAVGTCYLFPNVNGCDDNPPWGPFLDNPRAQFFIDKTGNYYILIYKYRGHTGSLAIEKSSVDLVPYIGRKVRIAGHFYNVYDQPIDTQCIKDNCYKMMVGSDIVLSKYTVYIDKLTLEK